MVEICKIHTHVPFPVGLFDHDNVGQPLGIIDFLDESNCQKLIYFFHNCFVLFWGKNLSFLLDGLLGRVNIQLVLYDLIVYPQHVFVSPSKDV